MILLKWIACMKRGQLRQYQHYHCIILCLSAQTISKHHRLHCFCREMSNAWRMMNAPY
ncbi:hypothetical protein PVAP13_3KG400603 [Panicum virgatum]|uniref:Uncharacterized protein n=1 Tax=Panicum virgatum TaxID=38727 RepID=A0A8T0V3Y6_PANVG|nr:hypothetical protein PVAP13_3KG400603 [Panicum virgatum]